MENMETDNLKQELIIGLETSPDLEILREMMEVGVMYGHKKTKTHPKFKPFIYTTRNNIEIIDLTQTLSVLKTAIEVLKNWIKDGKMVLISAVQPAAKEAVAKLVEKFNFPYVNERWIGGLLTNFKAVSQRIEYFKKIQADFEKGEFDKYTKKERMMINRNIHRMRKNFSGLQNLSKLPDMLFVIDPSLKNHTTAIREARKMKIPVMAILDSDDNPDLIDYPIYANDHAKTSIDWIINRIIEKLQV